MAFTLRRLVTVLVAACLSMLVPLAAAVESPGPSNEFDCDLYVAQLLADVSAATQDPRTRNAWLLLRTACVLEKDEYQQKFLAMANPLRAKWSTRELCLLAMIAPEAACLAKDPSTNGFATEVERQRYVLRSRAARTAAGHQWNDCLALYAMSVAGEDPQELSLLGNSYLFSLFELVNHRSTLEPPEFAIAYHLSLANQQASWAAFQPQVDGYLEVFARAGWAAGQIEIGNLPEGREALAQAFTLLEAQPTVTRWGHINVDNFHKQLTALSIAQLLGHSGENAPLDECLTAFRHHQGQKNIPPDAEPLRQFSLLYHKQGDKKRARQLFDEACRLEPWLLSTHIETTAVLARHQILRGDLPAALAAIGARHKEARSHPQMLEALFQIGGECALRGLSWQETQRTIEPRSDGESIAARLGWLERYLAESTAIPSPVENR